MNDQNLNFRKAAIILALSALFSANKLYSQEEQTSNKKFNGGFGYCSLSGEQQNLDALNRAFEDNGYGKINPLGASIGGGGAFVLKNMVIGGGGAWLANSHENHAGASVSMKGGYGYFSFGYLVHSGKQHVLYPSLGIGGGGYGFSITKGNPPTDFTQQLNSPAGTITTEAGGWMTNFQVNYFYFLGKHNKQGFFVGLKAGYKYSPTSWKISLNNTVLEHSPNLNMNGFFCSLVFGGGNITK